MNVNLIDTKLELLEPVRTTDAFGSEDVSFQSTGECYAHTVKLTGNRHEEVQEHFSDYRAEFNVRWGIPVHEHWQVRNLLDGVVYVVTNIIPLRQRDMKTLQCEKLNP